MDIGIKTFEDVLNKNLENELVWICHSREFEMAVRRLPLAAFCRELKRPEPIPSSSRDKPR